MVVSNQKSVLYRKPSPVTGVEDELANCCTVVYPNPASSEVFLKLSAELQEECTITLTDGIGRALITKQISKEEATQNIRLDISDCAAGIYFINVITPEKTLSFKVSKEN